MESYLQCMTKEENNYVKLRLCHEYHRVQIMRVWEWGLLKMACIY